jgi:hypothetical protein
MTKYYDWAPDMHIEGVIDEWSLKGRKLYDEIVHATLTPDELWRYREYTWTRSSAAGEQVLSSKGQKYSDKWVFLPDDDANVGVDKWDAMVANLKTKGWSRQDPLIFIVGKNGVGKVGEGNHRLAIAKELGIKVPVRFVFVQHAELDSASNR